MILAPLAAGSAALAVFLLVRRHVHIPMLLSTSRKDRSPGLWKRWQERRASQARRSVSLEMLPQALEVAIQALKAGQTVPQALELISQESASPLRDEFALVCREMAWGASTEQALEGLARRIPAPEFQRFIESFRLSRRTGADLTRLLQTLLEGMEERARMLRRMDSMTAQARLSGILMGSLPVFLLVVLVLMDPVLMEPLFGSPAGWCILAVSALLETAGFLWIRSLMNLETAT